MKIVVTLLLLYIPQILAAQLIPSGLYQREDNKMTLNFEGNQAYVYECGNITQQANCYPGDVAIANFYFYDSDLFAFERVYDNNGYLTKLKRVRILFDKQKDRLIFIYPDYQEIALVRFNPLLAAGKPVSSITESKLPGNLSGSIYNPNLPKAHRENRSAIGVVIGNRAYKNIPPVDFAENDADAISELFTKTFGVRQGNLILKKNIVKSEFEAIFGSRDNKTGSLFNLARPDSDVYIYYSGHGSVDNTGKTYFIPVELEKNSLTLQGYSVEQLFDNLSSLNVRSITVFIEACFMGETAYENVSPVQFRVLDPALRNDNMIVLSASGKNQYASWDKENRLGLFTYKLLEAFVNYQKTDENSDRKIMAYEVFNKLKDHYDGVPYNARLSNVTQNPSIRGNNNNKILFEY